MNKILISKLFNYFFNKIKFKGDDCANNNYQEKSYLSKFLFRNEILYKIFKHLSNRSVYFKNEFFSIFVTNNTNILNASKIKNSKITSKKIKKKKFKKKRKFLFLFNQNNQN